MTQRPLLNAEDVMTSEPVCVMPSTSMRELARTFEDHAISGAPVVNSGGTLIGVVSKTDLIRRCSESDGDVPPAYLFEVLFEQSDGSHLPDVLPDSLVCVEDFMTDDPVVVSRRTPINGVAELMSKRRIHRVIVVDGANVPVGIITSLDLLGVFPPAHNGLTSAPAEVGQSFHRQEHNMNTEATTAPHRTENNTSALAEITPDRIRHRAHQIFEARNGAPGSPTLDWLQAEKELRDAETDSDADRTPSSTRRRKADRAPMS